MAHDALRAITAQMLSLHRNNKDILSTANHFVRAYGTGQARASDKQISRLLAQLVPKIGITFIVLDGLDECPNYNELMTAIKNIDAEVRKARQQSFHGWLLCGRPSVMIPTWLSQECYKFEPNHLVNGDDITLFLLPEVQDLIDSGLLPDSTSAQDLVDRILPRTNGMFLWASLLMEYLRSPTLTIRERQDAISHINRLEGLDTLYEAIFGTLSKHPQGLNSRIQNIFHWVACAYRPLPVDRLRIAVSIEPGRCHSKEDEIPNFEQNLGVLTGSLIELMSFGTVQFIHLSAKEYFQQRGTGAGERSGQGEIGLLSSHLHITTVCLAYLFYTVPAEPLSGSAQETADKILVDRKYPLLDYASTFWAAHFADSTKELSLSASLHTLDGGPATLTRLVTSFVNDPLRVTTWIEAAWVFGATKVPDPRVHSKRFLKSSFLSNDSLGPAAQAIELVYGLSKDIEVLNREWSHLLREQPNQIWEPSIPTFTKSRFWVSTRKTRLIPLASGKEKLDECITIQSQISDSGLELAVIRLIVPL